MADSFRNRSTPAQAAAVCTPSQARQLSAYHQHRVMLGGHAGILFSDFSGDGPFVATIVFHGVQDQPPVPEEIQQMLDALNFQIRNNPR